MKLVAILCIVLSAPAYGAGRSFSNCRSGVCYGNAHAYNQAVVTVPYYFVGASLREPVKDTGALDRVRETFGLIRELNQLQSELKGAPVDATQQPTGKPAGGGSALLDAEIRGLIQKHCVSCHSADNAPNHSKTGVKLDFTSWAVVEEHACTIALEVFSGSMPKGNALPDDVAQKFIQWERDTRKRK